MSQLRSWRCQKKPVQPWRPAFIVLHYIPIGGATYIHASFGDIHTLHSFVPIRVYIDDRPLSRVASTCLGISNPKVVILEVVGHEK